MVLVRKRLVVRGVKNSGASITTTQPAYDILDVGRADEVPAIYGIVPVVWS